MIKTILTFDLSSSCVGVLAARVDTETKKPIVVKSCPIIPKGFSPEALGYMKSKKKLPSPNGAKSFNTYYKRGEKTITEKEKKKRDVEVRNAKNTYVLKYIGEQISLIVDTIKPDYIFAEKNEIFNGVLTSVLLGEVMGILVGISATKGITVKKLKVGVVRSVFNLTELVKSFVSGHSKEYLENIPDITKRALRVEMERIYGQYGLSCETDDESDACVVFHYWMEEKLKKNAFTH